MTRFQKLFFIISAVFSLCVCRTSATIIPIGEPDEFPSIDFPEGFSLVDIAPDGHSMQLQSSVVPVDVVVRLYEDGDHASALEALSHSLARLKARGDTDTFTWRNESCAISSFVNALGAYSGYGCAVELPDEKGIIVILVWTEKKNYSRYGSFMLSVIDGLHIDYGSYYEAGPVSLYAYPDAGSAVPVSLTIDGVAVASEMRETDKEASAYLIEREYDVLLLYRNSALWKEAWQRYYRMIFRDSSHRLKRLAFDVYTALAPNCVDETDLAQKLLSWTQGFVYEREKTTSDFASLPSIILGGGSDCDSRCLLLAVLLRQMNMDAIVFVSKTYSHAVAGLVSDHPGHSFSVGNTDYLIGETTAKGAGWGMISQEQDRPENWIPVLFP